MNRQWKLAMAASAIALFAGCEADGGFPGGGSTGGGGTADADGDGVFDSADLCPGTDADASVDGNGCATDQFGGAIPSGFQCSSPYSANATAGAAEGNLCVLGTVLDPILGALGTETCSVTDVENAGDGNLETFAQLQNTAALLDPATFGFGLGDPIDGDVSITLDGFGTRGPGSLAAFDIEIPGGLVDLGVLNSIRIDTLLDGTVVESAEAAADGSLDPIGLITLDLLEIISAFQGNERFTAGLIASEPYNALRITASASLLGAQVGLMESNASVFVYDGCNDAIAPTPTPTATPAPTPTPTPTPDP